MKERVLFLEAWWVGSGAGLITALRLDDSDRELIRVASRALAAQSLALSYSLNGILNFHSKLSPRAPNTDLKTSSLESRDYREATALRHSRGLKAICATRERGEWPACRSGRGWVVLLSWSSAAVWINRALNWRNQVHERTSGGTILSQFSYMFATEVTDNLLWHGHSEKLCLFHFMLLDQPFVLRSLLNIISSCRGRGAISSKSFALNAQKARGSRAQTSPLWRRAAILQHKWTQW